MRKLFARMGGKHYASKAIVPVIPEHEIYVEPFAGGASIYFSKEPSNHEVLADTDKDLIDAYKAVKKIDATKANKWDYTGSKEKFDRLRDSKPKGHEGKFYRYAFLNYNSFANTNDSYSAKNSRLGRGLETKFRQIDKYQERIKNTTIKHQGYEATIKQYDSPQTVFYLDPPYYNTRYDSYAGMTDAFDWEKFATIVKGIKGKWILSTNPDTYVCNLFKEYNMRTITTNRSAAEGRKIRGRIVDFKELLITNF